jgi:type I restriction enzyme S subunit
MELKPGYKQTEVGVVPEEWDAAFLGDKTRKVGSGITPTGGERVYKQEGRPFLRSQNVGWGTLLMDDIAFIDEPTHETFKATEIEIDDVFLNITGASIGRSAVADARVARGNVNQHVCIIRTTQDQLHPRFLNYFLLSKAGQRQIDSFQAGGNRQGLNFGQIRSFRLPVPRLPEQRTIAGALGDVDALLDALTRLIAKKRDLKQAAMQQLLTGQTRLPGFSGEWEVLVLGEGVSLLPGHHVLAQHCNSRGDGVPYLTGPADFPNGIIQHTKFTTRPTTLCAPNDILVTVKGSGSGSLVVADAAYCISRQLMAIRVRNWDRMFIYYSLLQNASQIRAASTGLIPGLSRSDILDQALPLPVLPEQTAIAAILSNMDAEIATLEERLAKTRALKQGMMQELLTGRTRLV